MKSFIFKKILNGLMCLVTLFGLFCFMSCAADAGSGSGSASTDKLVLDFNGGKMYNHKSATFTVEEITPHVGKAIDEAIKSLGIDTAFIKKEGFYLQGWTLKKNAEICVQNLPSYGTLYAKWGTDPLGGKDNSDEQDKTDDIIIPDDPAFDPNTPNPQPIVVVFDFDGGTHDGKLLFNFDFDYQLMQEYRGKPINDFLAHYDFDKSKMQKKGYVFNGWTLSQDGEDYVTVMPYSGTIKYWAKWIPENSGNQSDSNNPDNSTPKPLYEYSEDNTQITFTFVPSDFGFDWDIKENHNVQLMADCSKWAYDENYLMLKDKDGNYVITVDNAIDVYLGFKNWPGFKFCIFDEGDEIWVGPNEYIVSLPEDKIITGSNPNDPNFKIDVVDLNIVQDPFKLFENGDVVGDFSVKKGELDDGSIGWVYDETLGLDLTYEGEGVYTATFTYYDYMNGWGGGNGICSFKIRPIADSWVSSYGPSSSEKLTVDGEEVLCDSFQAGNFSVNLIDGVEYKITVRCALDGNVYVKVSTMEGNNNQNNPLIPDYPEIPDYPITPGNPTLPDYPVDDPDTPNPQYIVVVFDFDGGTHDGKLLFNLDFDYQLMQEYRGKPIDDFLAHYDFDKSKMQKKGYVFNGWTLSQDGEDYVTMMPEAGTIKYWAKWIPENE